MADNPLADRFEQAAALSSYGLTESLVSAEEIVDMPLPDFSNTRRSAIRRSVFPLG